LRLVWRLARFRFGLYLLSGSLDSSLNYVIPLIPGLLVRAFFDALTGPTPAGLNAATWLALLVAYAIARFGASVVGNVVEVCAAQIAGALLRTNALREVLRQPGSRALPASTGEAISRLRNDVDYVEFFLTWTLDPVGQTLVLVIALYVLARLDPRITLAVVLPVVAVVAATRVAARRLQQYRRSSQEAIGEVTGLLGDAFGGVAAVKAAGAEANVVDYLRVLGEARRRAAVSDQVFSQVVGALSANAASLGTGVLLLAAASAMRAGRFTVGDFALVVSYLGTLALTTSYVGEFVSKYRQTEVSLDRLAAMLPGVPPEALVRRSPVFPDDLPPPPARLQHEAEPFARLEAIGLSYR
jgi:ATP-binding cassette subfamily B protein